MLHALELANELPKLFTIIPNISVVVSNDLKFGMGRESDLTEQHSPKPQEQVLSFVQQCQSYPRSKVP